MTQPFINLRLVSKSGLLNLPDAFLEQATAPQLRRKKSTTFITQKKSGHEEEILVKYSELNKYLDDLDAKISNVIQHNQQEILHSYKNHFQKVKKQLEELRQNSLAQADNASDFQEKITTLQKQLAIFREESLNLFAKLLQKDKTIEEMKIRTHQLLSQKKHMDQAIKGLSKANKQLQIKIAQQNINQSAADVQNMVMQLDSYPKKDLNMRSHKQRQIHQKYVSSRTSVNYSRTLAPTMSITNKIKTTNADQQDLSAQAEFFTKNIKIRLQFLSENLLKEVTKVVQQTYIDLEKRRISKVKTQRQKELIEQRNTRFSMRSKSNYTVDYKDESIGRQDSFKIVKNKNELIKKSQNHSKNQQLVQYFRSCIETVKKQISKRKNLNTTNFFKQGSPITIEQFKKIDFFRLIELILQNDRLLEILYSSMLGHPK